MDVIPVANSQLVVCMRTDDPSTSQTHLDVHDIATRIRIFRDPELHPSAHAHLVHLFAEVGIPISLANSVTNPAEIQWMVKENYGLALIAWATLAKATTKEQWTSQGAQTLMGTFKTFAVYAGAVICFGGLISAGIRMMSGRFQDAIPGLFGALLGAGVLG